MNDIARFIITVIAGSFIGCVVAIVINLIIDGRKSINHIKKFKYEIDKQSVIRLTIELAALMFCDSQGISVKYYSQHEHPDCAGYLNYKPYNKNAHPEIHIAKTRDYTFVYGTILHEIGHYIGIYIYGDDSERAADKAAWMFIQAVLSEEDFDLMKGELEIFFRNSEVKDYEFAFDMKALEERDDFRYLGYRLDSVGVYRSKTFEEFILEVRRIKEHIYAKI